MGFESIKCLRDRSSIFSYEGRFETCRVVGNVDGRRETLIERRRRRALQVLLRSGVVSISSRVAAGRSMWLTMLGHGGLCLSCFLVWASIDALSEEYARSCSRRRNQCLSPALRRLLLALRVVRYGFGPAQSARDWQHAPLGSSHSRSRQPERGSVGGREQRSANTIKLPVLCPLALRSCESSLLPPSRSM